MRRARMPPRFAGDSRKMRRGAGSAVTGYTLCTGVALQEVLLMDRLARIVPCLWFDHQAEEAATFYVSVFKNSKITKVSRYPDAGFEAHHRPAGSVMTVEFELDGQRCVALNGGNAFTFNEAVSLQVMCDTQQEVDYYWEKLSKGGDPRPSSADGSRTSTGCRGRSRRESCQSCSTITSRSRRNARWKRCCA